MPFCAAQLVRPWLNCPLWLSVVVVRRKNNPSNYDQENLVVKRANSNLDLIGWRPAGDDSYDIIDSKTIIDAK